MGAGKTSEDEYEENCWDWEELVLITTVNVQVIHFLSLSLSFLICEMGLMTVLTMGCGCEDTFRKFMTHTRCSHGGMDGVELDIST